MHWSKEKQKKKPKVAYQDLPKPTNLMQKCATYILCRYSFV